MRSEQLDSGVLFPSLLEQLTEPEIRQLLDEDTLERQIRFRQRLMGTFEPRGMDSATERAYNETHMAELMLEQRTPAARALRYRDRLRDVARRTRGKLFNLDMLAGDVSSDVNVQMISRSFPDLPKLAAEEIVAHASSKELARMGEARDLRRQVKPRLFASRCSRTPMIESPVATAARSNS